MKISTSPHCFRGPLQAIIFDFAGTVIDYGSCAPAAAFIEVFRQFNVEVTTAEARAPMGRAKRDHIAAILEMPAVAERWQRSHGNLPGEEEIDQLYAQFLPTQLKCLDDHSQLIPGTQQAVAECRRRGLKIGSSTGYSQPLMDVVLPEARRQGFQPDCVLCADDVASGRPAPWMCVENARRLNVYPMAAIVKVDDTPVGIEAGRNAGMWTVGISKSGNLVGLTWEQTQQVEAAELRERVAAAEAAFFAVGAHYVIESVADLTRVLDDIQQRLAAAEGPGS